MDSFRFVKITNYIIGKLYSKEVYKMFTKLKHKWENWEHKDAAVETAKEFYKGYALGAAVIMSLMFVFSIVTGKKWYLVNDK